MRGGPRGVPADRRRERGRTRAGSSSSSRRQVSADYLAQFVHLDVKGARNSTLRPIGRRGGALLGAMAGQDARHAVVALVAGVFEERTLPGRHRDRRRPRCGVEGGIVDRDL